MDRGPFWLVGLASAGPFILKDIDSAHGGARTDPHVHCWASVSSGDREALRIDVVDGAPSTW